MSLFFNSTTKQTYMPLTQNVLFMWREYAVPLTVSCIAVPVGFIAEVTYERKGKKLVPVNVDFEPVMLLASGQYKRYPQNVADKLANIEFPVLNGKGFEYLKKVTVKVAVTTPASKKRKTQTLPPVWTNEKGQDNMFEMPTEKMGSDYKELARQIIDKPLFYFYDCDQPLTSPVNPMLDVGRMLKDKKRTMISCMDQHSIGMNVDAASAYGLNTWFNKYELVKRNKQQVVLSEVGGYNLWAHNKFIVCHSAKARRAVALTTEKAK